MQNKLQKLKNKKLVIGVTGGIGAGKSLACRYFEDLGCKVFYADSAAKELYNTNKALKHKMISEFGKEILENNRVSLVKIRALILNNRNNQKRVNKIVHPFVFEEFDKFVKKRSSGILIHEAALIFESGLNKKLDHVINISASKKIRTRRIRKRSGLTVSTIRNIMSLQLSEKEKHFLQLACSDSTYKQIASVMNVSERTVDGYRENIFKKLNVQSRTGMALEAIRRNIVSL